MLKTYGADQRGAEGALDIVEFTRAFCKLRDVRAIPAGLYRPSRQQDTGGRQNDGPGQSINNPLLPGRSATQTRAGVGKIGKRAAPYNGYAMPGEATSRNARPKDAFQVLMESAYFADVLIGDHFEKYARLPKGERSGDKVLDAKAFDSACANLDIKWDQRECATVFGWILTAHNSRGR